MEHHDLEFRAWSDKWNKMVYADDKEITLSISNGGSCHTLWMDAIDEECVPVMQYVGLKDINRTKAFSGDIVKNLNGDLRLIVYRFNSFEMRLLNGERDSTNTTWYFHFEIIGNIYENGDLLDNK